MRYFKPNQNAKRIRNDKLLQILRYAWSIKLSDSDEGRNIDKEMLVFFLFLKSLTSCSFSMSLRD